MSSEQPPPPELPLVGGFACLDFCNTLSGWGGPGPRERAGDPAALAAWCAQAFGQTPRIDREEWSRLIRLREALHAVFDAIAIQADPPADAVALLQAEVAEAASRRRLTGSAAGGAWRDEPPGDGTAGRHRLAMDALDLLLGGEPARLKRCAGHDCAWLFYDRSKNASRRWCLMSDCGTADKVRRFRQRRRSGPEARDR
ncbi:ABATE domain-containing protein [Inquilinus sp. Marseille-Q2685]|uniref:CGNR zinc finger domain-containing protein n=1 Tax=Inquilinus sp. Marseille-Q2685 TaxID=2866581 RepID=UPI001CE42D7E|nr:CGNR zinc finger domain-containing protein [Inquilinus sp. Marseille-Q2685]